MSDTKKKRNKFEIISESFLLIYFIILSIGYFYIAIYDPIAVLYDSNAPPGQETYYVCNESILVDELFNITKNGKTCQVTQLTGTPEAKFKYPWYYYMTQYQWLIILYGLGHIILFKREVLKRKWNKLMNYMQRINTQ